LGGFPDGYLGSQFSMDDSSKPNRVEDEEIWVFMARQTRALESIAGSVSQIILGIETALVLYILFVFGSAIVAKLFAKGEV
jgi:hypothetical protein